MSRYKLLALAAASAVAIASLGGWLLFSRSSEEDLSHGRRETIPQDHSSQRVEEGPDDRPQITAPVDFRLDLDAPFPVEPLAAFRDEDPTDWTDQARYDRELPRVCVALVNEFHGRGRPFHSQKNHRWVAQLNPDLARRAVLGTLRSDDVRMLAGAAYIAGILYIDEAAPILIHSLTERERGTVVKSSSITIASFLQRVAALGKLASRGNAEALEFLTSHVTIEEWVAEDVRLGQYDLQISAEFFVAMTADGLVYCPTEPSRVAIRTSGESYSWAAQRIALIDAFHKSGDSLEAYHHELTNYDLVTNKYLTPDRPSQEE